MFFYIISSYLCIYFCIKSLQSGPFGRPVLCIERVFQNKTESHHIYVFIFVLDLCNLNLLGDQYFVLREYSRIKQNKLNLVCKWELPLFIKQKFYYISVFLNTLASHKMVGTCLGINGTLRLLATIPQPAKQKLLYHSLMAYQRKLKTFTSHLASPLRTSQSATYRAN